MDAAAPGQVHIDLAVSPARLRDALEVLHRSFEEYTAKGQMAGAMLETVDSLAADLAGGVDIAVATSGGRIVALAKHYDAGDGWLYFGRLAVVPEARRRGIGSALVLALREHARVRGLHGLVCDVRAAETRNIALYERLGMQVVRSKDKVSKTGAVIACVEMRDQGAPA